MFDVMQPADLADSVIQLAVCIALTVAVGLATWLTIRRARHDGSRKDVYLAGGKLSWLFVAGSITLTNLSTDQLVGMNGNQMLLLAWWEMAGFFGLLILAALLMTGLLGAILRPLVTGLVASLYGWHAGFAVAALLMLVALIAYIMGQRHLPDDRPVARRREKAPPLTRTERRQLYVLLFVIFLTIPAEIAYPMVWSIGILWVDQYVNLATPLGDVPSAWFASMDSIGAIIFAPVVVALWAWQAKRGSEPPSITKIGIGTAIVGLAALLFAYGNMGTTAPDSVSASWAIAGWLMMGLAWMYYWPTLLALVSRTAPPAVASTLMGVAFLSPFVGHTLAGWVGSYFDQMNPTIFWAMDAAIALVGAAVILLLRKPLTRGLAATS